MIRWRTVHHAPKWCRQVYLFRPGALYRCVHDLEDGFGLCGRAVAGEDLDTISARIAHICYVYGPDV